MPPADVDQALARIRDYLSRIPLNDPDRAAILEQLVDSAKLFTAGWAPEPPSLRV